MVRHHPAPVFIIVSKAAHLFATTVIHHRRVRRAASSHSVPAARQVNSPGIPGRASATRQTDGCRCPGHIRCNPAGYQEKRTVCCRKWPAAGVLCPLRLRGQYQPEAMAAPSVTPVISPLNSPAASRWNVCAPEAVHQPGQYPVRRQRRRQHLIRFRHPLTPAEQPPRPLRTVCRQITMRT